MSLSLWRSERVTHGRCAGLKLPKLKPFNSHAKACRPAKYIQHVTVRRALSDLYRNSAKIVASARIGIEQDHDFCASAA